MHNSPDLKSRFTCILNENETDPSKLHLHICEQNEFRHLVHLSLDFQQLTAEERAEYHHTQFIIGYNLFQMHLKQKMILI